MAQPDRPIINVNINLSVETITNTQCAHTLNSRGHGQLAGKILIILHFKESIRLYKFHSHKLLLRPC